MNSIWDEEAPPPLPVLRGNLSADVCVIGLGGGGIATIAELARRGVDVIGIDAGRIGGGAAGRNAGFLLAGLADFFPDVVARIGGVLAGALYRHTVEEIQRLAREFPEHVRLTGSLRLAADRLELNDCAEHLRLLQLHGFPAEPYEGPEGDGLLLPTDGVYHPGRCLRAEAAKASRPNVRLFENSPVQTIAPGGVHTRIGRVRCRNVIVAVDGRLEALLPELQGRVRTARLQMLSTAPALDVSFPRPVYWRQGYEYWQQLPGGEIALGGFRDHGGESEWTSEAVPSEAVQSELERFLRKVVKTDAPIRHRWAACVAYTPNGLPVFAEVRERLWALGGYSGTGNIISRLCGRAAAQLVCGAKPEWADLLHAAHAAQKSQA